MRTQAIFAAIAALAAVAALGASAARAIDDPVPADAAARQAAGKQLYVRQGCYLCHGAAGQGSVLTGPGLVPLRLPSSLFRAYVRNPKGAMPPFTSHILPDPDLVRIEAYVRSFAAPAPYASIPLLRAAVDRGVSDSNGAAAAKRLRRSTP